MCSAVSEADRRIYPWIWRRLPFGLPGRIGGSLLLVAGAAALLWFLVFPWLDPFVEQTLLPWDDSQLEGDFTPTGGGGDDPGLPAGETAGPSGEPVPDEHEIPYETDG